MLDIRIDNAPEYDSFLKTYFEIGGLDDPDQRPAFDPRKTNGLLAEFEHLLLPKEFNRIVKHFKLNLASLIKQVLHQQDSNNHTPLHIASYYGDFKASRFIVDLGAHPTHNSFKERPLEVSKDKFARSVLQNLNDAATQASFKDVKYLVNCGNSID